MKTTFILHKQITLFHFILFWSLFSIQFVHGQLTPIENYQINANGQVQLTVSSSSDKYYLLQVRHHPDSAFTLTTSLTLGQNGSTIITESLKAYPQNHYRVWAHPIASPADSDNDGIDDLTEFQAMPESGPLNAAVGFDPTKGLQTLDTETAFHTVATLINGTPWVEYLDDVEHNKFIIANFSSNPKIYFINSKLFAFHSDFANAIGIDILAPDLIKGQLIYYPSILASNGTLGVFGFNFSNNETKDFATVQRTQELLASNMLFLRNNMSYFVTENNEQDYQVNQALYQNSRVPVLFETDLYAGINYWGLHQAEGYGFFRLMTPGEVPSAKDIVLYENIPNSLPRVGGIITSAMQTPLSHVNLRAIHDNVPNAFIRNPLEIDTIVNLLNHYIYFKTNQSNYEIREASIEEVNAWFDSIRPEEEQIPLLNLNYKTYLPLEEISFHMNDGFGSKTTNIATMRTFGFSENAIPNGYGIPFYFYQEFMKYNGFFPKIEQLIQDPNFIADRAVRETKLAELQEEIRSASMPDWMLDKLYELQKSFPYGTSIRCRSSTNNEDLPGFSGAGLYDSKTHHPNEGHLTKTIKQVYASLWNLRAFEERDFYRINHLRASMGVLCHPNFEDEKVNGVAVTTDPIYNTSNHFYLNSQLGEELVTNPENSIPEEILLNQNPTISNPYSVIQYSSLLGEDSLLMTNAQLELLRHYLSVIHINFAKLYHAENNPTFAMDIEFKIDSVNQLVVKQARPWVSFVPFPSTQTEEETCFVKLFPNPALEVIHFYTETLGMYQVRVFDLQGKIVLETELDLTEHPQTPISISHLSNGTYVLQALSNENSCPAIRFVKR